MPNLPRSERAFTLIELLVVVAIIAIVAALAVPALSGAVENSRRAKCTSNLHQIAVAFQGYLQDHDNVLPQRYSGLINGVETGYDENLLDYCQNDARIFQCPSQKKTNYPREPSYGMNWYYDNSPVTVVPSAAQTIMVAETLGSDGTGSHRADRDSASPGELDSARHSGKSNYLFFDGHVDYMAWKDTTLPLDMWGTNLGNHQALSGD